MRSAEGCELRLTRGSRTGDKACVQVVVLCLTDAHVADVGKVKGKAAGQGTLHCQVPGLDVRRLPLERHHKVRLQRSIGDDAVGGDGGQQRSREAGSHGRRGSVVLQSLRIAVQGVKGVVLLQGEVGGVAVQVVWPGLIADAIACAHNGLGIKAVGEAKAGREVAVTRHHAEVRRVVANASDDERVGGGVVVGVIAVVTRSGRLVEFPAETEVGRELGGCLPCVLHVGKHLRLTPGGVLHADVTSR